MIGLLLALGCGSTTTDDRTATDVAATDAPPHTGEAPSTGSTGGDHHSSVVRDTAICVGGCDDGLDCTADACDATRARCVYSPVSDCPWPASDPSDAISLVPADDDLRESLSGAAWNPSTKDLWLVRNSGPSGIWKLHERAGGGAFEVVEDRTGQPAEWFDVGDAESVTLPDPVGAPSVVLVLDEDLSHVLAWDLSDHRSTDLLARWDLSSVAPPVNRLGLEGITFVPDAVLDEWGFVGADGAARTSRLGMGGLVLVSHQLGGWVVAFDLDPAGDRWEHVGSYQTAGEETSGLELDLDTGRLYLWHGGRENDLEVARLSSTPLKDPGLRRFDTEAVFDHPGLGNLEGVAVAGIDDCGPTGRSLFLVEDEGQERSIARYPDWPLGCP